MILTALQLTLCRKTLSLTIVKAKRFKVRRSINIVVFTSDAIDLMNDMRKQKQYFDVVDLDPYGTAIPFLESALSCIGNNGLLCVTFTDMAVLCARKPHVCFYKYGAAPLGKSYCHE
jgi:tRNA (guanine26-N2/guanine27-N2)-dimethyltransferase